MTRRIRLSDLIDLVPPTPESARFRYFEPWLDAPFEPAQRTLSLTQAGWLMEAALLAYLPPRQAVPIFARFRPAPARVEFFHDAKRDVECYVLERRDCVVVVFRGSEVLRPDRWRTARDALEDYCSVILDWTGDANVPLVPASPRSARRVHLGFRSSLDNVWPKLGARLETLRSRNPDRRFWFTGHSLGGAMATLAADRFGRGTLVTFGAPRAGDARFAAGFRTPAYRIVNNSDIVAWVPPAWLGNYKHVGRTWLIDADGELIEDPPWFRELSDFVRGHVEQLKAFLLGRLDAVALDAVYDHSPLLYVRQLRALREAARPVTLKGKSRAFSVRPDRSPRR